MRRSAKFGIRVCIQSFTMYNFTLTVQGLASNSSYQLGRKYLNRGDGGLLSFTTKAGTGLSWSVFEKFKLVSIGRRLVNSTKDQIKIQKA
jgi:O-acetylhomoserine/O-acetylserine sulfhydrylase-like pyridoxal-dependent enzyme